MRFGVRGAALLQVWLMVFGFVGIVFMMGVVGALTPAETARLSEITEAAEVADTAVTITPTVTGSSSALSGFLGVTVKGGGADALASGLQWAVMAYYGGQMIGGILGFNEDNSEALGVALAAGAGASVAASTYGAATGAGASGVFGAQGTLSWVGTPLGGIAIGVVIFAAMYEEVETEVVTFNCMPWQAPNGGNDCETCNDDDLPCSEYRCRSLGQSCQIVNAGTTNEKCVYVNPRDVTAPVISPNLNELSAGHSYTNIVSNPPSPGFKIVRDEGDGCLKAFTPLEFGLSVNEPAQCKIDFNHTLKFNDMAVYVGGSNLYTYNHSEVFSLPGAKELEGSGLVLENGKDLTFFVRCKDKNGNENSAEYAVNFCIDPSPDNTAPVIEATTIENGGCVAENTDSADVMFYTNEPADCKWDFENQDYDLMDYDMSDCSNPVQRNGAQLFGCEAELTGIPRDGTMFYVRCRDQPQLGEDDPDRNENRDSFEFSLRGSTGLVLKNLRPSETIFGGVSPSPVELYVETLFGCDEGLATCAWSDEYDASGSGYIPFFDTYNEDGIHTQRLDLLDGDHEYFVRCVDGGGNVVENSTDFSLDINTNAPVVARVYEEGQMLKIVTVRNSECSYSFDDCDFAFDEGTEMPYGNTTIHVAEWDKKNTYYIKCRDEFLNEGAGCSRIVRPTENFL